ncbi:MAG: translation initiation factor IF-1A [Desulfurococcales archaeon ex4484_204]|nr:MAG: translation initiation factor IF-1A [Desulfurococcales archaeon ex4484_204]RLG81973.1 MAG: translation initiation factor IF-1A [Thermoprotei archaeon]
MVKKKESEEEEILLPTEEGQVICVVTEIIGANYVKVFCMDGKERMARIPGKLRRRVWINPKDVVLLGIWEFNDRKGDVLYRYSRDERKKLVEMGYFDPSLLELEGGA